ncbi:MAG TPA: ZIP family metal transporter [Propionicimonas sp.]|nr:ZIP family metal transporter [Propionicimonas sp.]
MNVVAQAAFLVAFPVVAAVLGSVIALVRPPGPRIVSGIQHFAAGVVMAALVGEIMPELQAEHQLIWAIAGFAAGALLVLALGAYGRRTEEAAEAHREAAHGLRVKTITKAATAALPIGMLSAMAIDLLLDGVLIGVGAQLGFAQALVLTIALTLEILFLGLSLMGELTDAGLSKVRAGLVALGLGLVTAVGAVGGAALLQGAGDQVMSAVLAFGAAALLYLVVEELLVEAHEEKESVALGAMFFLGFLAIYVLGALAA